MLLVVIQWGGTLYGRINLSFHIAHLTWFFWPLTVNGKNGLVHPWAG